jgi:hypothetical protein
VGTKNKSRPRSVHPAPLFGLTRLNPLRLERGEPPPSEFQLQHCLNKGAALARAGNGVNLLGQFRRQQELNALLFFTHAHAIGNLAPAQQTCVQEAWADYTG